MQTKTKEKMNSKQHVQVKRKESPNQVQEGSVKKPHHMTDKKHHHHKDLEGGKEFLEVRKQLPIFSAKVALLQEIRDNQTVIIIGETGSGKTTQLTQYIHHAHIASPGTTIACTQPRRVAAISVANRVSQEMGVTLGQEVGYTVRFDDTSCEKTKIKYMTDGMLLRQALEDPLLKRYSIILLDEAHERTLHTDVLFAVIKGIQKKRTDLKVIVMSATLDADKFSTYFGDCKKLYVQGRMFPVDIMYSVEPQPDVMDSTLTTLLQIHQEEGPGDILCFMTGQEEIENMQRSLGEAAEQLATEGKQPIQVLPIFAALPSDRQLKVFQPAKEGHRKIILATNIAETSITINGIKYVVDTGLVKAKTYVARAGIEQLAAIPVSKAQARQRAGRAGRESHGTCYRLYTEDTFHQLENTTNPEILRCNLSSVILQLKAMGINDVIGFDFMDKPTLESLHDAHLLLFTIGALDKTGSLTSLGRRMSSFPMDPRWAKTLIASKEFGCTEEAITIAAMLSVPSVFFVPFEKRDEVDAMTKKMFMSTAGDHITYLRVYKQYSRHKKSASELNQWCIDHHINRKNMKVVDDTRQQYIELCERTGIEIKSAGEDTEKVRMALAAGFFTNVAVLNSDKSYRSVTGNHTVYMHPGSVMKGRYPGCVLYNELVRTSKLYIRDVCEIDPNWAYQVAPVYFKGAKSLGEVTTAA